MALKRGQIVFFLYVVFYNKTRYINKNVSVFKFVSRTMWLYFPRSSENHLILPHAITITYTKSIHQRTHFLDQLYDDD